jgi:hypothetical protein
MPLMRDAVLALFALLLILIHPARMLAVDLSIPADTAYLQPHDGKARFQRQDHSIIWQDAQTSLHWYGQINQIASLEVTLHCQSKEDGAITLELQVGSQAITRTTDLQGGQNTLIKFGQVAIEKTGYHHFALSLRGNLAHPLIVKSLNLAGLQEDHHHFNLEPRRNAASVHLFYPIAKETKVKAFYTELTAVEDPVHTYYMACGWHRGYFGMQVNSPEERRIIFSVWDRGGEPTDPNRVAEIDRVRLVNKGDGVFTGRFGNEGTGGHSHLKYPWKTRTTQKFLVTAEPTDATHTRFSGFYFHPDSQEWMLISSWDTPGEGGYLRGLYSFSENFGGSTGHFLRKALYGNQWILRGEDTWEALTVATFSHDPTGREHRLDRYMGVEQGQFFLSHGGFLEGFTPYGARFERPGGGQAPTWP